MNISARNGMILGIICLFLLTPHSRSAPLDPAKLDQQISVELMDSSMSDAVAMISNAAEVGIVAPYEPAKGVIMTMRAQTVRQILDALSAATGTRWSIENEVICFRKPDSDAKPKTAKPAESVAPDEGMAEMIASLSPQQVYRLAWGRALAYTELSPYQQDLLKSMLSAPTVGIRDTGEVIKTLPASEQPALSFVTMPYLTVADPEGTKTMNLRLDSTPYINLKRTLK